GESQIPDGAFEHLQDRSGLCCFGPELSWLLRPFVTSELLVVPQLFSVGAQQVRFVERLNITGRGSVTTPNDRQQGSSCIRLLSKTRDQMSEHPVRERHLRKEQDRCFPFGSFFQGFVDFVEELRVVLNANCHEAADVVLAGLVELELGREGTKQ